MIKKQWILTLPLWYSAIFVIFNFWIVLGIQTALTTSAEDILIPYKMQLLISTLLIFFPNFILIFLLWTYMRSKIDAENDALALCLFAMIIGTLPQLAIYALFYLQWLIVDVHIPILMFGFPFIYLVFMMMGWVIGLFFVSIKNP